MANAQAKVSFGCAIFLCVNGKAKVGFGCAICGCVGFLCENGQAKVSFCCTISGCVTFFGRQCPGESQFLLCNLRRCCAVSGCVLFLRIAREVCRCKKISEHDWPQDTGTAVPLSAMVFMQQTGPQQHGMEGGKRQQLLTLHVL